MRILLAEDEPLSRRVLERDLRKLGYDVHVASNGLEAWQLFQAEPFPLVISDWEMPEMNGLDLIRRIRASAGEDYVYVVLLTSRSDMADLIDGMDAGADDFMTKPFELDELRVRLRAGERVLTLERTLTSQKHKLERANQAMRRDLEAAALIQLRCLPHDLPAIDRFRFAWRFTPCEHLAGDMLNVVPLDDSHVGMYLLDVSGHGVPSALLSVTLSRLMTAHLNSSSLLREVSGNAEASIVPPAEVALRLNERFSGDPDSSQYFTMLYAILDSASGDCRLVCAGHPPPIIVNKTGAAVAEASGFPIGLLPALMLDQFGETGFTFDVGDRMYFYSDGITEAANAAGEEFGVSRLLQALDDANDSTLDEALSRVIERFEQWCVGCAAADDVSIIGMEFR